MWGDTCIPVPGQSGNKNIKYKTGLSNLKVFKHWGVLKSNSSDRRGIQYNKIKLLSRDTTNYFHSMLKYISVQHKNTKLWKKNSRYSWVPVCIVSPWWWHFAQPFTEHRSEPTSPLTQIYVFSFFWWFFFFFFKYFSFLSRLKQVSLSLELEMRYTTSPFALLVLCTSLVNVENQQTSVAGQHTTTWCMADPQERSRHETKALKTSQCQKDRLWRWNSMTTNCSFIF